MRPAKVRLQRLDYFIPALAAAQVMADLAEYRERLGMPGAHWPKSIRFRRPRASRWPAALLLVYELAGKRDEALRLIKSNLSTASSLNQIRDDPDLAHFWNSPEMRQIAAAMGRSAH
jgi:hypothetical protein